MSFFSTGVRSFSKVAASQLTKSTTLVTSSLSLPMLPLATSSSASLSQLYIQVPPQMSSINSTATLLTGGSDIIRADLTKTLAVLETATATGGEAISSESMAVIAAVTTTALVTYSSDNSSVVSCEGNESNDEDGAVVPFDMNRVSDLRALINGEIDPKTIRLNLTGHRTTAESYPGSIFNLFHNLQTMKKGGKDETRRIYEAATSPELSCAMTFVHNGVPGATDHTRHPGFGFYEMNPNNPTHLAAVGKLGDFREVFAKKAKFKNWRALSVALSPSHGWHLNPDTPSQNSLPADVLPNKHRMFIYHRKDCNFFNGGPPDMGGNKERAEMRRKQKQEKKRLAKLEGEDYWKPATSKRRRISPRNKEDSKPAAKPAAKPSSDRGSRYATRAQAKK